MWTYRHSESREERAVKVVRNCDISRTRNLALHEVSLCRRVQHCRHILRLFEYFHEGDVIYVVFEKVAGGDLFELLLQQHDSVGGPAALSVPDVVSITHGVSAGLAALHGQGIAHRDIKSENILLCERSASDRPWTAKICDFNLSSDRPELFGLAGSRDYMAPEVVANKFLLPGESKKAYSKSCDLWSLGVLVYEMMFGLRPFDVVCGEERCEEALQTGGSCQKCDDLKYTSILYVQVQYPARTEEPSLRAISLLKKLLVFEADDRISADAVAEHPFLCDV